LKLEVLSSKEDIKKAAENPCLIHFSDYEKPWHKECFYGFLPLWNFFWKKCPVNFKKTYRYKGKQKIKFQIKQILKRFKLFNENNSDYLIDFNTINNLIINNFQKA